MADDPNGGGNYLPYPSRQIIRATCFTLAEKSVLLVLWSRANAEGKCWPSLRLLAAESCCDQRTATRAVHSLAEKGIIGLVEGERGQHHTYYIDPQRVTAFVDNSQSTDKNVGSDEEESTYKNAPTTDKNVGATTYKNVVGVPAKMYAEGEPLEDKAEKGNQEGKGDGPPTKRRASHPRVETWGPYQTEQGFTEAMVAEYGGALGERWVLDKIAEILDHSARKKRTAMNLYVGNWLREDAEKAMQRKSIRGPAPPDKQDGSRYIQGPYAHLIKH